MINLEVLKRHIFKCPFGWKDGKIYISPVATNEGLVDWVVRLHDLVKEPEKPGNRTEVARARKREEMAKMKNLIGEVAGNVTSWDHLAATLYSLHVDMMTALVYRIQAALSGTYDEGMRSGHAMGMRGEELP